eukprot:1915458-Prymnesium_polylepis.3
MCGTLRTLVPKHGTSPLVPNPQWYTVHAGSTGQHGCCMRSACAADKPERLYLYSSGGSLGSRHNMQALECCKMCCLKCCDLIEPSARVEMPGAHFTLDVYARLKIVAHLDRV